MADTNMSNLIINEMTYTQAQANAGSIGENELILTTDKNIPIPTTADNGKYVKVDNGDFILETVPDKANVDASNLTNEDIEDWKNALGYNITETIYDNASTDSAINWGYTSGIGNGITINGKDFTKYKYLIGTYQQYANTAIGFCDLTKLSLQSNRYVLYLVTYDGSAYNEQIAVINSDKTSIQTYLTSNIKLTKIVGVY